MQSTSQQAPNPPAAPQPSGPSRPNRGKPKQNNSRYPVAEEVANQPRKRNPPRKGLSATLGQVIPRGNHEAFKPSSFTTVGSSERNDPLLADAILVDGLNGAVECAKSRIRHLV